MDCGAAILDMWNPVQFGVAPDVFECEFPQDLEFVDGADSLQTLENQRHRKSIQFSVQ